MQKGAQNVKTDRAGEVTVAQLREIAEAKMQDLNANDVDAAVEMLRGSARSMGLAVVEE